MNRRFFMKASAVAVTTPFILPTFHGEVVPKRYRGFDISIIRTDGPPPGRCYWSGVPKKRKVSKYFYISNGSNHNGIFFDSNESDIEIWNKVKLGVDGAIDRYQKGVA